MAQTVTVELSGLEGTGGKPQGLLAFFIFCIFFSLRRTENSFPLPWFSTGNAVYPDLCKMYCQLLLNGESSCAAVSGTGWGRRTHLILDGEGLGPRRNGDNNKMVGIVAEGERTSDFQPC